MPQEKANNKRFFISLAAILIFALIIFGVCFAINRSTIPNFSDGAETSVVKLTTNSGVISEWSFKIEDTSIAEGVDMKSTARNENEVGGIIDQEYIFKGKKAGRTKIIFQFGSFNSGEIQEQRVYQIEVNEKLESRIKEL